MLAGLIFGAGVLVGVVAGRWWSLFAAVGVAVYVELTSEVEVPPEYLALVYALVAAAGIALRVLFRRALARR
jgi:hypothetical protein